MLFALFVIGQTSSAQALLSKQVEATETLPQPQALLQYSMRTSANQSQMYWVDALQSYDEETGMYAPQGSGLCYILDLSINGTDISFDGLVPAANWYPYETTNTIHGTYDANAQTVTISLKPFSESDPWGLTDLGTINMWGSEAHVALIAGDFGDETDDWGNYSLVQQDQIVFDVNDDITSLTPRCGFGGYTYMLYDNGASSYGFSRHIRSCNITKITDAPELAISTQTLQVEGLNVVAGAEITRSLKLYNKGFNATSITFTSTSDEVLVDFDTHMEGLSGQYVNVFFMPSHAGEYSADLTFTADNGSTVTTTLVANVAPAPDFSAVVKEGDISFAYDGDFPFVINSDLTGFPVAVDGVTTTDGTSELYAYVTVPEGQTGLFSWKGQCTATYSMGGLIMVDDQTLLDNKYSYMQTWEQEDISNTIVLGSGRHSILFGYSNYATWQLDYAPFPMNLYVYDLSFTTEPLTEYAAMQKGNSLDFGDHYVSTLAVIDSQMVELVNLGTSPLSVTGFSADGAFCGVVDGATAQYGEVLQVPLTFTSAQAGSYEGDVIVLTTAGNFTFHCQASAQDIPVDYSSIVSEGKVGFNTSFTYPFLVEGNVAKSSTAGIDVRPTDSWIEVLFDVLEGQTATLSWTGLTSCVTPWEFMGQLISSDYTTITIDGLIEQQYAGVGVDSSSSTFAEEDLTFAEGRHVIRFNYHKVDSYPEGDDCFYLSDVKLTVTGGENGISQIAHPQANALYDLSGRRLQQAPAQGLYIQHGQKVIIK